jgi:hypothetical protein
LTVLLLIELQKPPSKRDFCGFPIVTQEFVRFAPPPYTVLEERLRSSTKKRTHTGKQAEGEYTNEDGLMETWKVPTAKAIQASTKTMIA